MSGSRKQERDHLAKTMRARGATWVEISETLRLRFRVNPRVAFRLAHSWSQHRVADEWNRRWPDEPKTNKQISYWEVWPAGSGHAPSYVSISRLAELYECSVSDLLTDLPNYRPRDIYGRSAGGTVLAISSPATPAESRQQPNSYSVQMRAAPHDLNAQEADFTYGSPNMVQEATWRAASFAAWAETTNVGPMNIQRLETETRRLSRDYLSQSPLPIFRQTAELTRVAFTLIQEGHQHLFQTRELYVAAGRLSALLSWISGDLGQPAAAAEHARVAWICADQADHPTLRAWAMSVTSKAAFWDDDYVSAVESARAGQSYAAKGTALVMLACQEADALKAMGHIAEADHAVSTAKATRDRIKLSDDVGGLFSCGPARQANYEMVVHLAASRPQEAIRAADLADDAYRTGDQWAYGTWAQIRLSSAKAHIMLDDLDAAGEALSPVWEMPPEKRLDTIARRAGEVVGLLAAPRLKGSRKALELADRIESYCRAGRTVRELTR